MQGWKRHNREDTEAAENFGHRPSTIETEIAAKKD